MSPIFIIVKTDKTVKLDSKILYRLMLKNETQMLNIDNLIDTIQQTINRNASNETAYFSTLELKYSYSQLILDPVTSRHFNNVSGECAGAYRFITGLYGLTDMPAAFRKIKDYILIGLINAHCFLDDIIIVSRGSDEDHLELVYKCLKKLDEDNLRINISKVSFCQKRIEWLGNKFIQSGIAPLEIKTSEILILPAPKNLNQLR